MHDLNLLYNFIYKTVKTIAVPVFKQQEDISCLPNFRKMPVEAILLFIKIFIYL